MSEAPERIWAGHVLFLGSDIMRQWWDTQPKAHDATCYLRADTVVDKVVAEGLAKVLRGLKGAHYGEVEMGKLGWRYIRDALAAYEEATK